VFKAPLDATPGETKEKDFIKRVIGVPGDLVRITPGYVMIGQAQYGHRDLESILRGYASPNGEGKVKLTNGKVLVDGRLVSESEVAAAAGEPNNKVKVVDGKVLLNGKAIREPYTAEDPDLPYPLPRTDPKWIVTKDGIQYVKIPQGKLLVMGDNRNDSNDGRFWGLLDRPRVLGKAMFIFWPLTRIKWVR
jgi:type IV secretory pathway protease TraF